MIRVIIIEDEQKSLRVLSRLVEKYFADKLAIIGTADGIDSGISLIKTSNPELIFLDIELIDGSSFSILKHFPQPQFKIIFTTAFDSYAIKAFKFSAIDYLLKPIDDEEFQAAVQRYIDIKAPLQIEQLTNAQAIYYGPKDITQTKLAIKTYQGTSFVSVIDIVAFCAEKSYTDIHCLDKKKYTTSKNLGYYEELLSSHREFVRIHHSTIINISYILELHQPKNSHSAEVNMRNGTQYIVSTRRLSELRERLIS